MSQRGFLPCFSKYRHKEYPIEKLYGGSGHVDKLKTLVSCFIDSNSPQSLKLAIGHEVQTIRPDSGEGKRLISQFSTPHQLYRIDYGNTPFRIIFSLENG